jgi:hypothetical protein
MVKEMYLNELENRDEIQQVDENTKQIAYLPGVNEGGLVPFEMSGDQDDESQMILSKKEFNRRQQVITDGLEKLPRDSHELKRTRGSKRPSPLKNRNTNENNFLVSKAVPFSHDINKVRENQKSKILSTTIDDMYVAENYYKGIGDDSIMYEKDGLISRML